MARKLRKTYKRLGPSREPYDSVLIVCEGSKSEPNYFKRLCFNHQLSSANIRVTPAGSSDPLRIVQFAEVEMQKAVAARNGYDRVFCVFDRDGHATYDTALERIANSDHGKSGKLRAVTSWPCFEVWLSLHFEYRTAAIVGSGGRTSGENMKEKLKQFYPEYTEGRRTVFDELSDRMDMALTHAKRLKKHNRDTGSKNPDTDVHLLVEYLLNLRTQP